MSKLSFIQPVCSLGPVGKEWPFRCPQTTPHNWGIPPSKWERGPSPAKPHWQSSGGDASPSGPARSQELEAKGTCFKAAPKMFRGLEVNPTAVFSGGLWRLGPSLPL